MRWTPSIVPNDQNIYLVEDCYGKRGCVWRETDAHKTDRESVILDLLEGQYFDPRRIVMFNTAEHVADDISEDIARELQTRCDAQLRDVPSFLQQFVDRYVGSETKLRVG
jgi:hypothetical protein